MKKVLCLLSMLALMSGCNDRIVQVETQIIQLYYWYSDEETKQEQHIEFVFSADNVLQEVNFRWREDVEKVEDLDNKIETMSRQMNEEMREAATYTSALIMRSDEKNPNIEYEYFYIVLNVSASKEEYLALFELEHLFKIKYDTFIDNNYAKRSGFIGDYSIY